MTKRRSQDSLCFADLVEYKGKQWRFIGMGECGEFTLVRQQDEHAFEIVDFQSVWHDDWEEIKLLEESPIDNPFPDWIPWNKTESQKAYSKRGLIKKKGFLDEYLHELSK